MSILRMALVAAIASMMGCSVALAAAADRVVAITVTVRSAGGTAVAGVPVSCERADGEMAGAITGTDGQATISLAMPDGAATVYTRVQQAHTDPMVAGRSQARAAYAAAISASHFRPWYTLEVAAEATTAQQTIEGSAAITVTGRSPEAESPRDNLTAFCYQTLPPLPSVHICKPEFSLPGLAAGSPALIAVSADWYPSVKVIELTAAETQANVNLGEVDVPDVQGTEECTLRMTDRASVARRPELIFPSVTLIAEDRSRVLEYLVDGRGIAVRTNGTLPLLAPGKYAIVPGLLGSAPATAAVWGEMKRTSTIPAGIPTITVVAGGPNVVEFAGVPARDASMQLPAYP